MDLQGRERRGGACRDLHPQVTRQIDKFIIVVDE
jgi:hypothetical protein